MTFKALSSKVTPYRVFLIDGLGAFVSALMLGVVLVQLQSIIGLSVSTLYMLAAIATAFAVYSLTCFYTQVSNWRLFLKAIALANLTYCALTGTLVILHWDKVTSAGLLYFGVEMLVIVFLGVFEWSYSVSHNFTNAKADTMPETNELKANTFFIEVSGAGLPEVDGLFVPSTAPPAESESGTISSPGYWNGKMAWDRADGKSERSPALSYSNSYKSWRICRLDGHLAYDATCEDDMPPIDREWHVYKKGVAPAPKIVLHHCDPRLPCPSPNVIFVLGGPGAGKGTMCELAEAQLGWTHLSTGELLRAERQAGGPTAEIIEDFMTAGKLVPNEIIVSLLKDAMETVTRTTGKNNFLLDGFPRSLNNMEGWYAIFGREAELPKMLYFEGPYAVLEKRILGRAEYSGRSDDNVASIKLRFDTFKAETLPTVDFFKSKNKCVEIDTSQDRPAVYAEVIRNLAEFTDRQFAEQQLTVRAEILLGLRPYPGKA